MEHEDEDGQKVETDHDIEGRRLTRTVGFKRADFKLLKGKQSQGASVLGLTRKGAILMEDEAYFASVFPQKHTHIQTVTR